MVHPVIQPCDGCAKKGLRPTTPAGSQPTLKFVHVAAPGRLEG